jgi:tetratricopeptide (TPR) repeat protein
MLELLVPQLQAILGDKPSVNSMLLKDRLLAFHRLLGRAAAAHEGVILVIDDADALLLDTVLPFHWLPPKISNVKLILSGRSSGTVAQLGKEWRSVEVSGLDKDQQAAALVRYLRQFGKALPPHAAECLLANDYMRRPLALRIAADELRLAESPPHLLLLVNAFTHVRDTVDLFGYVLARLEREHGRRLISTVCGLLACSRGGLWESELRALVQEQMAVSAVQWSSIVQAFSKSVIDRDGLYALHFEELYRAVQERYLQDQHGTALYRIQLISWLQSERMLELLPQRRVVDELPWQLCQAQDWKGLMALLVEPHFFLASWRIDPSQVIAWWRLIEKNCGVKAAEAWNRMLTTSEPKPSLQAVLGLLYAELGDAQAAVNCVKHLLSSSSADIAESCFIARLVNLAGFLLDNDQSESAAESLELAATLLPRVPNHVLRASYHNACGNLSLSRSDPAAAMGSYSEAEQLHVAAHNEQAIAECRHNKALVMLDMKQYADACKLLRRCAATFRVIHDIELLCKTLISLAVAQERSGKLGVALKSAHEAQSLARERDDWQLLCKALQAGARIHELGGDRDSAERDYVECEQSYEVHGEQRRKIDILLARAVIRINLGQGGYRAASEFIARAARIAESAGSPAQRVRISNLQQKICERFQCDTTA